MPTVHKGGGGGKTSYSAAAISYEEASAVVERKPDPPEETGEAAHDLEQKLQYIQNAVPTVPQAVMGSTAGAGSGTFHIYRHIRRREQDRLRALDDDAVRRSQRSAFQQRELERQQWAEQRTAKKRSKRLKRKHTHKSIGSSPHDGSDASLSHAATGRELTVRADSGPDVSSEPARKRHEPVGGSLD